MTEECQIPIITLHLVRRFDSVAPSSKHHAGPSELEIRRRLTLEAEEDELASAVVDLDDTFTETKYLLHGLDLEEQQ